MRRGSDVWARGVLAAGLVAGLAACGGGGGGGTVTNSTPTPTPTPCTQTTLDQGPVSLNPRTLVYDDFSVPDTGRPSTSPSTGPSRPARSASTWCR